MNPNHPLPPLECKSQFNTRLSYRSGALAGDLGVQQHLEGEPLPGGRLFEDLRRGVVGNSLNSKSRICSFTEWRGNLAIPFGNTKKYPCQTTVLKNLTRVD